jgi:hypothetical protein
METLPHFSSYFATDPLLDPGRKLLRPLCSRRKIISPQDVCAELPSMRPLLLFPFSSKGIEAFLIRQIRNRNVSQMARKF